MSHLKTCTQCDAEKDRGEFYSNKSRDDGLDTICKDCRRGHNEVWRKNNPDYQKAYYFEVTKPRRKAEQARRKAEKARRKLEAAQMGADTSTPPAI